MNDYSEEIKRNWHRSIGTYEVRRKLLGLGDIMKPLFSEKINESLKNINLLMSKRIEM